MSSNRKIIIEPWGQSSLSSSIYLDKVLSLEREGNHFDGFLLFVPCDFLSLPLLWERFQVMMKEEGTHWGRIPKMNRKDWECRQAKAARVCRTEYGREKSCTERELQRLQRNYFEYSVEYRLVHMCEKTTRGWGKSHPKGKRETVLGFTQVQEYGLFSFTRWKKMYSSQGIGQSPQKGVRYSSITLKPLNPFMSFF